MKGARDPMCNRLTNFTIAITIILINFGVIISGYNTINSVYGDSLGSENDTPAKAKRGLNKIYIKYKEYDTYKEAIEEIKTLEINGFGLVYRRPANDQHEYVCMKEITHLAMFLLIIS